MYLDEKYMPDVDDILDAAEELYSLAANYNVDVEGPSRILEQVAIALLHPGARRDILLEGRTDLSVIGGDD